jgi:hypothetical protein
VWTYVPSAHKSEHHDQHAPQLLLLCDCDGSNGNRLHLFKEELCYLLQLLNQLARRAVRPAMALIERRARRVLLGQLFHGRQQFGLCDASPKTSERFGGFSCIGAARSASRAAVGWLMARQVFVAS